MDRTSKIILAACFVLIVLWGPMVNKIWPPKPLPPSAQKMRGTNAVSKVEVETMQKKAVAQAMAPLAAQLQSLSTNSFQTAVLENDEMVVHFSGQGGGIKKVEFKKYNVADEPPATINDQAPTSTFDLGNLDGLELGDAFKLKVDSKERTVVAVRDTPELSIVKTYQLKENYQVGVKIKLTNKSKAPIFSTLENPTMLVIGVASPLSHLDDGSGLGFDWYSTGGKYFKGSSSNVSKHPYFQVASAQWVAVKNQFFTLIVTAEAEPFTAIRAESMLFEKSKLPNALTDQKAIFTLADLPAIKLAPGESKELNFDTYAGPRDYKLLTALGQKQEEVMDYGIWSFFCKILLGMMSWFHGWMGNWGLAIIAMTVVIKVVFWPLTDISTRSMKRMQALAPKMKELQEKHKDQREKLGVETMKLYREYGVNPLGGCLPMLVQIPIFFALFSMLRTTVQLRGAEFLWIKDLSMPDTVARIPFPAFQFLWWHLGTIPVNPMPLIMVVAQIWQMRIMPPTSTTDSSQKMMMWMMPVFFLFICYNFSSALALYWTVQTALQAVQTYIVKNRPDEPLQKIKRPKFSGLTFGRPLGKKK